MPTLWTDDLLRDIRYALTVDTGFKRDGVVLARFADFSDRPTSERLLAGESELLARIRSLPQVSAAAATTKLPLDTSSWTLAVALPASGGTERLSSKFTYVSPQYFATVGMRLLAGRDFGAGDTARSRPVAIVNETFVRRYLGPADAVGTVVRTLGEPGYPPTVYEVIGIVSDTKYAGLREPLQPITFVPLAQHPSLRQWPAMVIRSSAPPAAAVAAVKQAVGELRPKMTTGFTVLETQVRDGLVLERLMAWLAAAFGVLAALLSVVGLYGVISCYVVRRRHEIAIRLALGSGRSRVVRLVLRDMSLFLSIGLTLGGLAAAFAARGASGLLFGLSPHDPATLAAATVVVAGSALAACLVAALRASRIDATAALRSE